MYSTLSNNINSLSKPGECISSHYTIDTPPVYRSPGVRSNSAAVRIVSDEYCNLTNGRASTAECGNI